MTLASPLLTIIDRSFSSFFRRHIGAPMGLHISAGFEHIISRNFRCDQFNPYFVNAWSLFNPPVATAAPSISITGTKVCLNGAILHLKDPIITRRVAGIVQHVGSGSGGTRWLKICRVGFG